jgi:antitoxin ParD1/3/4
MNISLTDKLKSFVEERTKTGLYSGSSDYVRGLIRQDYERQQKLARMQELVTEAYESGVSEKTVDEIFDEALKRHQEKQENVQQNETVGRRRN